MTSDNIIKNVKNAWTKTKDNFKAKRYFVPSNYISDVIAGNLSRSPAYMVIDAAIVGVSDDKVIGSALNTLIASSCGWSVAYIFGNSILSTSLGETYKKHAKKIDATYSAITTFGLGIAVNLGAGYSMKQALAASSIRAATSIPLGPVTRYFSDAFREMRGEPAISTIGTKFKNKQPSYSIPRAAAMIAIPLAIAAGAIMLTPNEDIGKQDNSNYTHAVVSKTKP